MDSTYSPWRVPEFEAVGDKLDRCPHSAEFVVADILEGDLDGQCVQWCRVCGAHRFAFSAESNRG